MKFSLKQFLVNLFHKQRPTNKDSNKGMKPATESVLSLPEITVADAHERRTVCKREEDMAAEAQLAIFLDKYLYTRFPNKDAFSRIERIYDKKRQLSGIDVQFTETNGRVFNVDEKAQLGYLNKRIPTFAFEIDSLQKGILTIGWLCNNSLKTNFYLLIWPCATQDESDGITWDCFTELDCLLIQKKKLLRMLEQEGLTIERMIADARLYRREGRTGKIRIAGKQGIYYFATPSYSRKEEPINIVISKDKLRRLAQRHYIVTPDKIIAD